MNYKKEKQAEKAREYSKNYYANNKDEINKKLCAIITCQCGRKMTKNRHKRHLNSIIHLQIMGNK